MLQFVRGHAHLSLADFFLVLKAVGLGCQKRLVLTCAYALPRPLDQGGPPSAVDELSPPLRRGRSQLSMPFEP